MTLIVSQKPRASDPQQPSASGRQPSASGQQPSASGQQPSASGQQPNASGQQPSASGPEDKRYAESLGRACSMSLQVQGPEMSLSGLIQGTDTWNQLVLTESFFIYCVLMYHLPIFLQAICSDRLACIFYRRHVHDVRAVDVIAYLQAILFIPKLNDSYK